MTKPRLPFDLNPFYAAVGMTDLAARRLREIGAEVRGETIERFARERGFPILTIAEMIEWRKREQREAA